MEIMLVYSSLTGNTRKLAEGIESSLAPAGLRCFQVEDAPKPSRAELLILGFWVDKGRPDKLMLEYFKQVNKSKVAFFFTLGDYPDGAHAAAVAEGAKEALEMNGNEVLGFFPCQGRVDPEFLERLKKILPPDHPHVQMTPERKARLEEAARHPNDNDVVKAAAFIQDIINKLMPSV